MINQIVGRLFDDRFSDILSGYRVMSRRFVKSFPALAIGFEIETLLTIHALELRLPSGEIECEYRARVEGTESKLRTFGDGLHILFTILILFKEARPFTFFGLIALALFALSLFFGTPVIIEFIETGLVPRFPTAILATGLALLAAISLTAGLVLDTVSRGIREIKRLHYLTLPPSGGRDT